MIAQQITNAIAVDMAHVPPGSRHAVALVDMATLPDNIRKELTENSGLELHPIFLNPNLENIKALGPHLIAARLPARHILNRLFDNLHRYDSNTIIAWITSTLAPAELAQHLSQASFSYTESGERYLLRFYDDRVFRVLLRHAPRPWSEWLFSPIVSWWVRGATPHQEQLHRFTGSALPTPPAVATRLVMNDTLCQLLDGDILPHQLLDVFSQQSPSLFDSTCNGVRLALIESLLSKAKDVGLTEHPDLVAFVGFNLQHRPERLEAHPHWHAALERAVSGEGRLKDLFNVGAKRP